MTGARRDTISFLSDYGTADESVGVIKSVIRDIAPHAVVIDLTHEVPPHDVRAGGLALARAVQYVAPGVVLAVVDPDVGTDRRAVAVEVAGGEGILVGPDNGILASAAAMAGGATAAVELNDEKYHLPTPAPTFSGRDVFAPVCAHLCNGVALGDLGEAVDPAGLRPGVVPLPREEDGALVAEVLWVDRFGNAQLNVGPEDLPAGEVRVAVRVDGRTRAAVRAPTYAAIGTGEVGLVVDAYGLVSVCLDRASAADELGLADGDAVTIEVLASGQTAPGRPSPVTLTARPDGRGAA